MSFTHNVNRLERCLSVAAGFTAIASGIYQGGASGIFKAVGGAVLVQRGISGHCVVKGLIEDAHGELESLRLRVEELQASMPQVKHAAARARNSRDARLDNAVEETFPASDPISP